jgi:DNA-binding protein HU-beta/integration host factor subunit alpha
LAGIRAHPWIWKKFGNFWRDKSARMGFQCRRTSLLHSAPAMATITKRELSIRITETLSQKGIEISQQDVAEILQTFIDQITDSLAHGNNVVMRKFGAFEVREMKAKLGRNPKNPTATVKIPARVGVKFKPGKELKDKIASSLKVVREKKKK